MNRGIIGNNYKVVLACVLCILLCTGCNETVNDGVTINSETFTTKWSAGDSLISGEKTMTPAPETWPVVSLESVDTSGNITSTPTDGDPSMSSVDYCQTQDYYYEMEYDFQGNANIYYFDKQKHTYLPLCNKPECNHKNEDCISYFSQYEYASGLEYYDGMLYTMVTEVEATDTEEEAGKVYSSQTAEVSLYAISPDGMHKQKIQSIKTVEQAMSEYNIQYSVNFFLHRGYVYYTYVIYNPLEKDDVYQNGNCCLYRVPIGGKETEAECIYAFNRYSDTTPMPRIKTYGNYLYFCDLTDESDESGYLCRVNLETKQVEKLPIEQSIYDGEFYICSDGIYYQAQGDEKKYWRYSFENKSSQMILDLTTISDYIPYGVAYDETYWYAVFGEEDDEGHVEKRHIYVLNQQFQQLGEIVRGDGAMVLQSQGVMAITDEGTLYGWIDKSEFAKSIFTIHEVESSE